MFLFISGCFFVTPPLAGVEQDIFCFCFCYCFCSDKSMPSPGHPALPKTTPRGDVWRSSWLAGTCFGLVENTEVVEAIRNGAPLSHTKPASLPLSLSPTAPSLPLSLTPLTHSPKNLTLWNEGYSMRVRPQHHIAWAMWGSGKDYLNRKHTHLKMTT
jgi:hypothetical protein